MTLGLTFVGALTALRGIAWFALACMVLLPVALGRTLEGASAPIRGRLNRGLALGAGAVVATVVLLSLVRSASWYERSWPNTAVESVRVAASDPAARVFATDRHADWLLWKLPELRGRIAYDVRFELYEPSFFERLAAYHSEQGPAGKRLRTGTTSSSWTRRACHTAMTFSQSRERGRSTPTTRSRS